MTSENQVKLLQAYTLALQAEQDGIAELLEDIILAEMKGVSSVMRPSLTPKRLDDTQIPPFGSRNVVTCESGKEVTS